ncbi:hypothetical protein CDD82_4213 [Ophiocordyceps australis]|uniref:CUE domain-containing protein n=1 Tax=Ophiocordyceps australis TaxID=1399860 RepID=A0A2C5Z898_9HYPO|nr:hypothetical protein CDD82_4213 [Ophiocordyceps australis]
MASLPPLAPFPKTSWQQHLSPEDWKTLISAWTLISREYLALSDHDFTNATAVKDGSMATFVATFASETALTRLPQSCSSTALYKTVLRLVCRLLALVQPPELLQLDFLCCFAGVFSKKHTAPVLLRLFTDHGPAVDSSLASVKKLLIPQLDLGIKGDVKLVESRLNALNPLVHASPHVCAFFLAGSDFLDGLVLCFRVMNPPLRKAIVTTTYLCLVGLVESEPRKWALLSDQLFALKSAAEAHKQGPLNANDSLVAELVTVTPLLTVLKHRLEASGAATDALRKRIQALEPFKKGPMIRPARRKRAKKKLDKGKGRETAADVDAEIHIHRMSQITQVQDLFPDLGSGFISKCFDEYGDDVERVVANLLGDTLAPHLASADRGESLLPHSQTQPPPDLAPRSTPPLLPRRRNVFDGDEFDELNADVSKISLGKRPQQVVGTTEPANKAAILSALAAFDSDDDERDDTYDAADVGGTVDSANQEADGINDASEEMLYSAWQRDQDSFGRDAATRRSSARAQLRDETGMTDEAIEGWAAMLARNAQQRKRLEAKYAFAGQQTLLQPTAWRASPGGSGAEDGGSDAAAQRGGRGAAHHGRGRGRGRGGGRGGGGGGVAGPAGDKETEAARRHKEAHKGSRANHNRRQGRAKKMARAGFAG